ncbi:unnamed protein product [Rangifer tarandus platyrhynchus]|uniref:Uncharacterized protein n=1 Tax=Rangifer tarandus platyrhynchus TaxID=3082113 RepID=A0ABN8YT46_RANTA|nr:unnamed protein product [Rangifer tarandus platyrhynchus]
MRIIRNTTETDENHPRIYVKTKEDKTADGGDTQVFTEKGGGRGAGSRTRLSETTEKSQAQRGMTGPGSPPGPKDHRTWGAPAPPPAGSPSLPTPPPHLSAPLQALPITPPAPVSLPFGLIFTSHAGWGAEGKAEKARGQLLRRALVRTPRRPSRIPPSPGAGSTKTARPRDRPTDPAGREGAEQARAYTSPARSGANVARRLLQPHPARARARHCPASCPGAPIGTRPAARAGSEAGARARDPGIPGVEGAVTTLLLPPPNYLSVLLCSWIGLFSPICKAKTRRLSSVAQSRPTKTWRK